MRPAQPECHTWASWNPHAGPIFQKSQVAPRRGVTCRAHPAQGSGTRIQTLVFSTPVLFPGNASLVLLSSQQRPTRSDLWCWLYCPGIWPWASRARAALPGLGPVRVGHTAKQGCWDVWPFLTSNAPTPPPRPGRVSSTGLLGTLSGSLTCPGLMLLAWRAPGSYLTTSSVWEVETGSERYSHSLEVTQLRCSRGGF